MDIEAFKKAYTESRNGTDNYYRHSLVRNFVYTDGVRDCAQAGCYWLIDILATETLKIVRAEAGVLGIVTVTVADSKADIDLKFADDAPPAWTRHVEFTDLPDGEWLFGLQYDGERAVLYLLSEH